tara:strand:- start:232 stop:1056 length:825 start_codon:yes stop_codon:yes gene_type:complete
MINKNFFKRELNQCQRDGRIFIDSEISREEYVQSFGFEWTKIDGFIGKEAMSHGHIFGRFFLPNKFFEGKTVVDIGCGNGRIGRLIAPLSKNYIGCDLSESVYAFPAYLKTDNISLVRASGTNLPMNDKIADVSICWGVLHHMDDPMKGLEELFRVTKPNGEILIFIYSKGYDARRNLNQFSKKISEDKKFDVIESTSDMLDGWREVDKFYADSLSQNLFMSVKQSREWQMFQWYDGITPEYHWSLEESLEKHFGDNNIIFRKTNSGCYRIKKI